MPNTKTAKKTPNKSDFIRAQPASLSAAEVVAKGKEKGVIFSESLVYKSRGPSKAKKTSTSTVSKTPATKPTPATSKTSAKIKSKADFVRARAHLSPKELVEKAKAEGVKFGVQYVYRVRAMDKTGALKGNGAAKPRATPRKGASVARPITTMSSTEDLLRALGAEIGLGRAVGILAEERAKLRNVIGW